LNDLLVRRFAGLGPETRAALFVAAAASSPTASLVGTVMGIAPDPVLQPAVDAAIVRMDSSRIEFTHPLLAAAAYSLPGSAERGTWHARLAEAVNEPEARARHLALATPGPDPAVAEILHAAGQHARSRGAPAAAGELFAEAIHRLPPATANDARHGPSRLHRSSAGGRHAAGPRAGRGRDRRTTRRTPSIDALLALSRLVKATRAEIRSR
jgi:hypothetical protein